MQENRFEFSYTVYESKEELPDELRTLLEEAQQATTNAYAPYSRFRVGAAARLQNGELVSGSNQENASFPAGICAERVLLSTVASRFPGIPVTSLAVTYQADHQPCDHPIAPCGICRQSLQEYEMRTGQPVQLILGGKTGPVYVLERAGSLLPLAFTREELE